MAYEKGAYNPVGQQIAKPSLFQTVMRRAQAASGTAGSIYDDAIFRAVRYGTTPESLTEKAPMPEYDDSILRVARGQGMADYVGGANTDGSAWMSDLLASLATKTLDRIGQPSDMAPQATPAGFWTTPEQQGGIDTQTVILALAAAGLVFALVKA